MLRTMFLARVTSITEVMVKKDPVDILLSVLQNSYGSFWAVGCAKAATRAFLSFNDGGDVTLS